jgi:hypothetical protein
MKKVILAIITMSAIFICVFWLANTKSLTFASGNNDTIVVISDIASWEHPVKDILVGKNIKVLKVELLRNKTYPIFYLEIAPIYEFNSQFAEYFDILLHEIAKANGYWDFRVVDVKKGLKFEVECDKKNKLINDIIANGKRGLLKEMIDYNETVVKNFELAMDYLEKNVPEIAEFRERVRRASNGEVKVIMRLDGVPDKYSDDEYHEYYCIYVGEDHPDHIVRWNTFYVSLNLSKILVDDLFSGNIISVEQWRKTNRQ